MRKKENRKLSPRDIVVRNIAKLARQRMNERNQSVEHYFATELLPNVIDDAEATKMACSALAVIAIEDSLNGSGPMGGAR